MYDNALSCMVTDNLAATPAPIHIHIPNKLSNHNYKCIEKSNNMAR